MDLKLDLTSGDIEVDENDVSIVDGADAIRQHLQIRFGFFLGEWFLDTDLGVPWFRDILIKKPSFVVVQEVLKKIVLDTPGVLQLIEFDFTFDNATREATLDFQCLSDSGVIDFSQVIEI